MIDLGGFGKGGTIGSVGGIGTATIQGTNIRINGVQGIGVPTNSDTPYTVTDGALPYGLLNFTTGAIQSVTYDDGTKTYTYTYSGGGSITIVGDVPDAGISGGQTLLAGSFYDGSMTIHDTGAGYVVSFGGTGSDSKNPALLSFFGVPEVPFTFAGFSIAANLSGDVGANGSFSSTAFSTDIVNTTAPEPAVLATVGAALCGFAFVLRRRVRA
jgi:hypothetical protein